MLGGAVVGVKSGGVPGFAMGPFSPLGPFAPVGEGSASSFGGESRDSFTPVSYTHLRAHET